MLGEVIHGYRIDQGLSADKGGFGDVYFATHVESGAAAVIKVLKPEMSAMRDIVARFFNEARAAASIHHPGIVQIHNVGYHGERAYLLMERLRGDDLENRLQHGPLPLDRTIVFMRQTAGAIGAAHERGIVHRDLKPANLFIVADPDVIGGERVKVLDFGIAKLSIDGAAGKTQGVFGTPAYMSPEQCASTGAVDVRSDLYSLGCIFYELVCGRPPFGHGGIELVAAHLRDTAAPPRALAPWLPPPIEQVILRLLEKQPERRIPSCPALIAALDEASAAAGFAGASQPQMPVSRPMASRPMVSSGGIAAAVPSTTLSAAAGAGTAQVARKRSAGLWAALGAVVAVGAVVIVVAAGGGGSGVGDGSGSGAAHEGSQAGGSVTPPPEPVPPEPVPPEPTPPEPVRVVASNDPPAGSGSEPAQPVKPVKIAVVPKPKTPPASTTVVVPKTPASSDPKPLVRQDPAPPDPKPADPKPADPPPPTPLAIRHEEVAERLNEEGKALMYKNDFDAAAKKFKEAAAHHTLPKYLINACAADLQSGRLRDALTACELVERSSPTADQRNKAEKLMQRIDQEAARNNIKLR